MNFLMLAGINIKTVKATYQPNSLQSPSIPPSMTLLAAGAKRAAQNGNSALLAVTSVAILIVLFQPTYFLRSVDEAPFLC